MANNRVYLFCKQCTENVFLAKTYGKDYFFPSEKSQSEDEQQVGALVLAFLNKHLRCGPHCSWGGPYAAAVELRFDLHEDQQREIRFKDECNGESTPPCSPS